MNKSHSLIIGASIVLGCLMLNLQQSKPVAGQVGQSPHGRFQMMATSIPNHGYVYITDSETGQTWMRVDPGSARGEWIPLGSPVK